MVKGFMILIAVRVDGENKNYRRDSKGQGVNTEVLLEPPQNHEPFQD